MSLESNAESEFKVAFGASHLLYGNNMSEDLHGHNYVLTVKLKTRSNLGLNQNLRESLIALGEILNNKIIIAADSQTTVAVSNETTVRITLPDTSYYELPKKDCYVISEISSSAELLSKHVFDCIKPHLDEDWEKVMIVIAEIYQQQDAVYWVYNSTD